MNKQINNKIVPKLRFPEFRNAENWKIELFGDLFSFQVTNSFTRDNLNYDKGSVKNIHYGDIHTKFSTLFDLREEIVPYINSSMLIEKIKFECYCIEGDMIFADASEDLDDVGKSIEIVHLNNEKLLSGMHTILARQKEPRLNLGFGGHLFKSYGIRSQIQNEAQGTKVLGISIARLSNIKIYYPLNKVEQKKIASCLSSLDELISAQNQKLETLKTHKKGLMQQLFPTERETLPKLRFPKFQDAGGWKAKSLGSICDYWNGASHEGAVTENGNYYLISLNSIDIEGNLKSEMKRLNHTDNSLQKNDLIMVLSDVAHGNFLGLTDIIPDNKFVLNQRMAGLRVKESNIANVSFLRTFINYNQKYFKQKGQGSSQLNLSKSSVTDFLIKLPNPLEQQKIADCLSSLDELIFAQTQKLNALKVHKIGLMQQLFPTINDVNK